MPLDGRRSALAHHALVAGTLDAALGTLAARARSHAFKLRVDGILRDRAANGRYAWTFGRSHDFAAGIWVIDPVFMVDTGRQQLTDADTTPAREERYFAGARLDDDELRDAPRTTISAAPPSAPATPKRPPATAASATTSTPPSPTPPTTSCTPCARSSADCCAGSTPR